MALGERGRNPLIPRSTAETVCALRAMGLKLVPVRFICLWAA